jgi:DNA modification methylase
VTYWGLRDYQVAGQIGLEPDFRDYIAALVDVFREVRRVLRKDGTLWLNMGDSYVHGIPGGGSVFDNGRSDGRISYEGDKVRGRTKIATMISGLKPKDLCGIPWRIAFALQADGWYLRQDIIWSKPNPMPESVTDRCTKTHEYLFLLSKSERYNYDAEAIKENCSDKTQWSYPQPDKAARAGLTRNGTGASTMRMAPEDNQRNKRSVWEIATAPFSEAHFATFPPALIEPCILAGCPKECCAKCGAPWARQQERGKAIPLTSSDAGRKVAWTIGDADRDPSSRIDTPLPRHYRPVISENWSPSCSCNAGVVGGTVLDCFGGAGTTGLVADRLQRNAILIELSESYAEMGRRRIQDDAPLFAEVI